MAACGEPEPLGIPAPAGGDWITKDAAYRSGVTTGSFAPLTHGHCYYELSGPALGETDLPLLVLVHKSWLACEKETDTRLMDLFQREDENHSCRLPHGGAQSKIQVEAVACETIPHALTR